MNPFRKALKAGLSPANVMSWSTLEILRISGAFLGTLRLRIKAALLGVRLGANVRAHGPVGLMRWPGGIINIGDDVQIISSWRRATASTISAPTRLRVFGAGAMIDIGAGCQLTGASITARSQAIRLGKSVMLGPDCIITDSDFHAHWPPEDRKNCPAYELDAPVEIGDYVWIGMRSMILKGVKIGSGAIIGAGSIVVRDIPANVLACGQPAKPVKILGE